MATTYYTVFIDDAAQPKPATKKDRAVLRARDALAKKEGFRVRVETASGTVVFEAARRKVTKFTKPYTKRVELAAEFTELVPSGYEPAYERPRNGAAVVRRIPNEGEVLVNDDELYGVIDTVKGVFAGYAATTRQAGQIMRSLGASRKTVSA